jgi:SAM-dependent methyltransferase
MHLDVTELRDFYYRSALGRAAQRVIRDELLGLWPEAKGQAVAGYGFAVPLLRPYLSSARRVIGLMPGPQGVMPWPAGQPNVALLCEETLWPISTGFVDKLVVMHGLETSDQPSALLEECWRVLGPGGRAVFVVPNRAGLWSRSDATPFGFGRPYSMGQLETVLRRHRFVIERGHSTLYQPPSTRKLWRRVGGMMEQAGRHLPVLAAGGVLIVEVAKQVATPARGIAASERRRAVLDAFPVPAARGPVPSALVARPVGEPQVRAIPADDVPPGPVKRPTH